MSELSESLVIRAVTEVLANKRERVELVRGETQLRDLSLDSLEVAELFATIEDMSGLELDPDSAEEIETVADLTRLQPVAPGG
jgi:acyl carrier protein